MEENRRNMMKVAGESVGGMSGGGAERARGMARGLTLLTMRDSTGAYRLGVKTDSGILDVPEAAKLLHMRAPETMDDLLQHEDGPALNALVEAALKSSAAKSAFIKEESVQYGPVVTRPEKIVCVGLNYRRHAQEIGMQIPKEPVLFSKYNNALSP